MNYADSLEQQAQELSSNLDPAKQRERNIDAMYNDFITNAEKDTYIKSSEFKKFEVLYSDNTRKRLASTEATEEERAAVVELSEEFYRRVNTQRPIHVIDDYNDTELFVLPPIFRRLNTLTTPAQAEATQIFASTFEVSDNNNPTAYLRKQIATDNLYKNILAVQDEKQLQEDRKQYADITTKFHREYLHDTKYGTVDNTQPQISNKPSEVSVDETDDDDYLDFDE